MHLAETMTNPLHFTISQLPILKMAVALVLAVAAASGARSQGADEWTEWQWLSSGSQQLAEIGSSGDWKDLAGGEGFSGDSGGAWLRADVIIPSTVSGEDVRGKPIGLQINSDCGGEIYVNGGLQGRYDNDHAGMALLTKSATPGQCVPVLVRAFRDVSDQNRKQKLGESRLVLVTRERAVERTVIRFDVRSTDGRIAGNPIGLSQGAGLPDYSDQIAQRFRDVGIRWFRMDNIFTNAVKRSASGRLVYDWSDLDRRLEFMQKVGCEFIACVSYMPEALEAFPNPDRHARPRSYAEWEELCYQSAKHAIETGRRIPYWEVWNEANSGWLKPAEGEDGLQEYLKLYDATWRGIRRADSTALIGGPCNASGPWNTSPERGYAVNGEKFMRGLLEHCDKTGAPLDFISWHEYFHPPAIFREEADVTRQYMRDYPKASRGVREFMITEWNYAWWADWPQDNEVGAAWMVNSLLRALIPSDIAKPCFFLAMDFGGADQGTGSWGMLLGSGRPKPVYNAAKMLGMLAPERLRCHLADPEVAVLGSTEPESGRTTVLLLNYAEAFGVERPVSLSLDNLPKSLAGGTLKVWAVDKAHSNSFTNKDRAELECTAQETLSSTRRLRRDMVLPSNSITLVELVPLAGADRTAGR